MNYRERDEEIASLRAAGWTLQELADEYGVTRARIWQITERACVIRGPRRRLCPVCGALVVGNLGPHYKVRGADISPSSRAAHVQHERRQRQNHIEQERARRHAYYWANPDRARAAARKSYYKHLEQRRRVMRERKRARYHELHPSAAYYRSPLDKAADNPTVNVTVKPA